MSDSRATIAQELLRLGDFYGLDDQLARLIPRLDLDDYVEIVLGDRGLELVTGGVGKEQALVDLARDLDYPRVIVEAFQRFAARFPGRMLYTKVCFGPSGGPPSMYFVAIEPWSEVLGFLATLPSIQASLPDLRADLGDSQICFLLGFSLDERTRGLLVKTYHLFDRRQTVEGPTPFLVSHRLSENRVLRARKHYAVNVSWDSLRIDPRWSSIVDHAQSMFGDRYTLMKGGSPEEGAAGGMKVYLFRHDRRQGRDYQIRSYNYYVDEGIRLLQVNDQPQALRSFASALDFAPEDPQTHQRIAACHILLGQHLTGIEHALTARALVARSKESKETKALGEAVARATREIQGSPSVASYLARGSLLFCADELRPALSDFTQAAALDPTCAEAHNAMGGVYLRLGLIEQAVEACTHASSLSARVNGSNLSMARSMLRVTRELADAPSARLHDERGKMLYHLGLLHDARDEFVAAARLRAEPAVRVGQRPAEPAGKKYLFIPLSSYGYLFPAIKLAHLLQSRSQTVRFATCADHGALLETNGIESVRVSDHRSGSPFLHPASWFSPETVASDVAALNQVIEGYRPDVIVTSPLVLSAFLLAERHSIPLVVIGFSEYLFPGVGAAVHPEKSWRIAEMTRHYNNSRAALKLPPIEASIADFPLIGDQYFIRSIPQLNDDLALPPRVDYAGGLYWEPAYVNHPLAGFIADSKRRGVPVAYVQIGRLFGERDVWESLVESLSRLPMRFVVDVGRADYLKSRLPEGFHASSFVPIGAIAHDIEFVVSSGQSTTVVSAILHGKQLLCIPHSSDSLEIAAKVAARGMGITIHDPARNLGREALLECHERFRKKEFLESVLHHRGLFQEQENNDFLFEKMAAVVR